MQLPGKLRHVMPLDCVLLQMWFTARFIVFPVFILLPVFTVFSVRFTVLLVFTVFTVRFPVFPVLPMPPVFTARFCSLYSCVY